MSASSLFWKVGDKWAGPLSAEGPLGFNALVVAGPADCVTIFLVSSVPLNAFYFCLQQKLSNSELVLNNCQS